MCSFLIDNQEFMDIENTKYILSNLIANKRQMDEEVIYSTAEQTVLWATKGDEIKHEKFYFFISFSFLFSSCFNWSHNCENHIHIWPKNFYLLHMIIKDNQGFRAQLQWHLQNCILRYITCITDDCIPLKHHHSTEGFHLVV